MYFGFLRQAGSLQSRFWCSHFEQISIVPVSVAFYTVGWPVFVLFCFAILPVFLPNFTLDVPCVPEQVSFSFGLCRYNVFLCGTVLLLRPSKFAELYLYTLCECLFECFLGRTSGVVSTARWSLIPGTTSTRETIDVWVRAKSQVQHSIRWRSCNFSLMLSN